MRYLILCVSLALTLFAQQPNDARSHYDAGLAYAKKAQEAGMFGGIGYMKQAREEWQRAIDIDPRFVSARLRLIEFYVMAPGVAGGSEEKAIEQAEQMKKLDVLDGHRAYMRIYTMQKKYDLAIKEMVEGVREQPKSAKAHYLLGNAYLNAKTWKEALHEYDMALSLDGAYMPAHFRIGQVAAQSESNLPRGEESMRKYLIYKPAEDEPAISSAWYWLGMLQEKQGKKTEARQSYTTALKLAPDLKEATEALKRL